MGYPQEVKTFSLMLRRCGATREEVARITGVGATTLWRWEGGRRHQDRGRWASCWRCRGAPPPDVAAYGYLLGQYLGDGHIARMGHSSVLRIFTCDDYPGVCEETARALRTLLPNPVHRVQKDRCTALCSISRHWLCLLPQHGPGKKHEREIRLEPWQQTLVDSDPRPLVRGLLHSDGCRADNKIVRRLPSGTRHYSYPRYFFSNRSDDVRRILTDALDALGIAWRTNNPHSVSIARREAVAALDAFVGPKS